MIAVAVSLNKLRSSDPYNEDANTNTIFIGMASDYFCATNIFQSSHLTTHQYSEGLFYCVFLLCALSNF